MDGHGGMEPRRGYSNLLLDPLHSEPRRKSEAVHLTRTIVASTGRVAGCTACHAAGLLKWLRSNYSLVSRDCSATNAQGHASVQLWIIVCML
jgi:hypothetical protein